MGFVCLLRALYLGLEAWGSKWLPPVPFPTQGHPEQASGGEDLLKKKSMTLKADFFQDHHNRYRDPLQWDFAVGKRDWAQLQRNTASASGS